MLQNLRLRLNKYFLQKKMNAHQRSTSTINFGNSKSIGIIFDSSLEGAEKTVRQYCDKLAKAGKHTHVLAYVNDTKPLENFSFKQFNKTNLNWYFEPKGEEVNTFLDAKYDIFINLSLNHLPVLEYITAMANASLRVGPGPEEKKVFYDLMIDAKSANHLNSFIGQVDYFLNLINK